jgi:hypothetical protein
MTLPIRRKFQSIEVPRFDPLLVEKILIRVQEIREQIEELRNNRPWDK